jgi:Flp pilus assembly pilin Flp
MKIHFEISRVLDRHMFRNGFLSDESGATTVDWTVLSAGVVGMGLAVMMLVSRGVGDASDAIASTMADLVDTAFTAVTAGLTPTDVWSDPNASFNDLRNTQRFSFAAVIDFSTEDEGIIFETGGGVLGTVLYQHDGVLYLQAGNGRDYGAASDRGEASWRVIDGRATIEGSLNADGGLALIVNGETVSQSSFTASRLAGPDAGSIAGSNSGVAANRGGFTRRDAGHPGVSEVVMFEGQTTGHELVPLD